jgi:hypothetical protein
MPAFVAGIHALSTSRIQDVDGRDTPGHDEVFQVPLAWRWIRVRSVGPFCSEATVSSLNKNLGITPVPASFVCGIYGRPNSSFLILIRPEVFPLKADLPLALMIHNGVLKTIHEESFLLYCRLQHDKYTLSGCNVGPVSLLWISSP